ncbi:MAG: peptide chain release factor N(5)-glutamine methyltransferase [Casimicrobium sp.]
MTSRDTPLLPRAEVRMLVSHVLKRSSAWLVAHDDEALSLDDHAQITALAARRAAGEPMAYLLGERDFYGRTFRCSPAALIPRPETEHLVEHVLTLVQYHVKSDILDVGTGTGCIALTLALELLNTQITALDVSPDALALARENAEILGASNVEFIQSDWFSAVATDTRFDLIVSNPPYIVPGDAHLTQGDLRFEPGIALADTVDGLGSYRQLASGAMKHLKAGGWLVVEHGFDQGASVPALMSATGFSEVSTHSDLAGHPRVTAARRPRQDDPERCS